MAPCSDNKDREIILMFGLMAQTEQIQRQQKPMMVMLGDLYIQVAVRKILA